MFVDSHCHLEGPKYAADRGVVVARAREAGVDYLLAIGNGSRPEEVLAVPADFFMPMKLQEAVTQQRITGFMGVLAHMKHIAVQMMEQH